jgi:hypothetical protein
MIRALALTVLLCDCVTARAQGGPPMETDDPGTPGDGRWEINLAAEGTHFGDAWHWDLPGADINYGVGEHIQLNVDLPWEYTNASGHWRSGIGDTSVAVKWRFLDAPDGIELSTYPRLQSSLSSYSERIGVASPNKEFFLPMEMAAKVRGFDIAADLGRHFVEHDADYWSAGIVAAHSCGSENVECMAEIHREWQPSAAQTLLNFGMRGKISESLKFLGAIGREFGHAGDDQARAVVYLGVQISR